MVNWDATYLNGTPFGGRLVRTVSGRLSDIDAEKDQSYQESNAGHSQFNGEHRPKDAYEV
jgi:hypothetical protein